MKNSFALRSDIVRALSATHQTYLPEKPDRVWREVERTREKLTLMEKCESCKYFNGADNI